jgi:hypothetical protein
MRLCILFSMFYVSVRSMRSMRSMRLGFYSLERVGHNTFDVLVIAFAFF